MLAKLRKIHLYAGWLLVLAFVLTGQYMRHVIHPAMEASDRLKTQPILGALDARVPWWLTRLRRRFLPAVPDDDNIPEFDGRRET